MNKLTSEQAQASPPPFDTAVFIDLENLLCGYSLSDQETEALDLRGVYENILMLKGLVGRVAIGRAYANWQSYKTRPLHQVMNELNVSQEHVQAVNVSQKNLADIALCTDVMDVLHTRPNIKTFVIVSGDGGFAWLVRRLNEYGKNVVIAAYPSQTNKVLKDLADIFIDIDDPRGVRQDSFKHQDPTLELLLNTFGVFDATRASLLDLQDHAKYIFARIPELELLRTQLEIGVSLSKIQLWLNELIVGFDHYAIFGHVKFLDFVQQYTSLSSGDYQIKQLGSEYRLHFKTGAANETQKLKPILVDIQKPVAEPQPVVHHRTFEVFEPVTIKDTKEALALVDRVLDNMLNDGQYSFIEGVSVTTIANMLRQYSPTLKPLVFGATGFTHLIGQVLGKHQLMMLTPNQTGTAPEKVIFDDQMIRGFHRVAIPPLNDTHSAEQYRRALADQENTKWFFIIQSPELVKAVADYLHGKRKENLPLADWVRNATDVMAKKPSFAALGAKLRTEVQNVFLALNASACFTKTPDNVPLASQRLTPKADLISAGSIIDQLRSQCAIKIEKTLGVAAKEDVLKLVVG